MHTPHHLLRSVRFPIALLLCLLLALPASAVPYLLNYQGRVAVGGQNHDGAGYFKFALVDGGSNQNRTATATATASVSGSNRISGITITDGGSGYTSAPAVTISGTGTGAVAVATISGGVVTAITVEPAGGGYAAVPPPVVTIAPPPESVQVSTLWTNDGTQTGLAEKVPVDWLELPVTRGLYALQLGDPQIAGMSPLSAKYFSQNDDLRLRVWFSPDRNVFTLLTPDQRIAAVGYAMMADDITDGAITSAKIAEGAVTGGKIAPGSIGLSQLSPALQQTLTALNIQQEAALPVVTSADSVAGVEGSTFSYTITASGSPIVFGATGLPPGLTRTGAVVSGSLLAGNYTFSVTASNTAGTSAPKVVNVQILGPVYVDFATGNDVNAGTAALPVKTFTHGLAVAAGTVPQRNVVLSRSIQTFSSLAIIPAGMVISGGRTPGAGWTRTPGHLTPLHRTAGASAGVASIVAMQAGAGATLEYLDISTDHASGPGHACVGVNMIIGAGQKITGCRITPGHGSAGSGGTNGSAGAAGADGRDGGVVAAGEPRDWFGGGALGQWATTGLVSAVRGGNGGYRPSSGVGIIESETGFSVPGGGAGGAPGAGSGSGLPAGHGLGGGNGNTGTPGSHGLAGASGTDGVIGKRGGGGGGGGRVQATGGGVHPGGGGGEGGTGGSGGKGSAGGQAGGWSFAVRITHVSSAGWNSPILTDNELRPRNGGTGGGGGNGGAGGEGGTGGTGVFPALVFDLYQAGHGGSGGDGGDGGDGGGGGGGGGGSGGSCYGIYSIQQTAGGGFIVPSVTLNGVNTFSFGTPGSGALGGLRGGSTTSRAASGSNGITANFNTTP